MATTRRTGRDELRSIAHEAMLQRGLLPDFSPAVLAQTDHIAQAAGASEKGIWARISGPTTEGRVVRGFEGLDVGDRVRVQLVRTDVARGFIDFAAVDRKK